MAADNRVIVRAVGRVFVRRAPVPDVRADGHTDSCANQYADARVDAHADAATDGCAFDTPAVCTNNSGTDARPHGFPDTPADADALQPLLLDELG